MTGLAVVFAALSLNGFAYPLPHAERVTRIPVVCVRHLSSGGDHQVDGIYFPGVRAVALERDLCWAIANWRAAGRRSHSISVGSTRFVGYSIWALGHELTHDEQYLAGRPFDEHEADCGGLTKFASLKHRLGIARSVPRPKGLGC